MDHKRREKIQILAYHIWEREGRPEGRAEAHWEQAVRESALDAKARPRKVGKSPTAAKRASRSKTDSQIEDGEFPSEKSAPARGATKRKTAGARKPKSKK
jgi:hypothetical protein